MTELAGLSTPAPRRRPTSPTRVRSRIVGLLALISALTYLDRLNLSIAGKYIQDEYSFSTQTMGWILGAFVLGYALFQVPGGWAGDRRGPRRVLTFAIVWWSVFTAGTALAPRLPLAAWLGVAGSFIVVRFLIGVGEASAMPNGNKVISYWMGEKARGVGNAIMIGGIGFGGVTAPVLVAWIMRRRGWRMSFYVCSLLGCGVAALWHFYSTDRPEQHPGVNAAELALIRSGDAIAPTASPQPGPTPWKKLLSSRSVWALMFSYFCEGYPNYIFYTWFFIYLVRVRGLTVKQGGLWAAMPYLAVVLLAPAGGWISDRAAARFGTRRGRQFAVWLGMTLSALLLVGGANSTSNLPAILLLSGAMGFNLFATGSWWAACIDMAPNFSGSLSALMNTCGNLGGTLSPILTAYIATRFGWTRALDFAALMTLAAPILWLFVDAGCNIENP